MSSLSMNASQQTSFHSPMHVWVLGTFLRGNHKLWLEYLFYAPDQERSGKEDEMLHILEEGFLSAEQYEVRFSLAAATVRGCGCTLC